VPEFVEFTTSRCRAIRAGKLLKNALRGGGASVRLTSPTA
jgi:hypothetical protein